jgi:hypothetical protein
MLDSNPYDTVNITGAKTTTGTTEETLDMSLNGATAAASLSIPAGRWLVIRSIVFAAEDACRYKIEKSINNGSTWFTILPWRRPQDGSDNITGPDAGLRCVPGGKLVKIRVRIETPDGTALVSVSMDAMWKKQG